MRRPARGQALVEFALIIPVFLLVLLGLFDLGRAVFYFNTISNASREAVRLAIVDQNQGAIRQEAVTSAAGTVALSTTDVSVQFLAPDLTATGDCATPPYEVGCVVKVEVTKDFQPATPFVGAINLKAETYQSIERRYSSP